MQLAKFPRVRLFDQPTPIEPLPRLTKWLDCGAHFWVKRDDCTPVAGGGNKVRKLEFLAGEAQSQGADLLITQGAVQSNHVRQTAGVAARLGMGCRAILERRVLDTDRDFEVSGNVFLDRLLGVENLRYVASGTDMAKELAVEEAEARQKGRRPYVIPGGGSNRVGALGYVNCALELLSQANDRGINFDWILHPTGSSGTQAGLAAGLCAMNCRTNLLGISVRAARDAQIAKVSAEATTVLEYIGARQALTPGDVAVDDRYVEGGYGIAGEGTLRAILIAARLEGLLLDPTYTGKGFAGLIDLARRGRFRAGSNVLFIHTGGAPGLFGYLEKLAPLLDTDVLTSR